jgi:hypothetical protein
VYGEHLKKPEAAEQLTEELEEHMKGEITIVSGLPRSGTSMMMQMLEKGGIPIYTDKQRIPDENNPKGYYEHEAVKSLGKNKKWLQEADGKALKVISHLLFELPARFRYKVVFMERDLDEVLMSQHKMLVRTGKAKEGTINLKLAGPFRQNLERVKSWVPQQKNIDILYVSHAALMADATAEIERINQFLGGKLDTAAMATVIDRSLHREKSQNI